MADIFSDGFESGNFSAWTASGASGTGAVAEVIAGAAYAGSYGAHFKADTTYGSPYGYGRAYKDFSAPANNKVYLQCRLKVLAQGDGMQVLSLLVGSTRKLTLERSGANWRILAGDPDWSTANLSSNLSNDTWYLLELEYDGSGASAVCRCYVDGVQKAEITSVTKNTPTRVQVEATETVWSIPEVYVDAVKVADAYIGSGAAEASSRLAAASTLEAMASQRLSGKSQLEKVGLARLAAQLRLEAGALIRWAGKASLEAVTAQRLAGGLTLLKVEQERLAGGVFFEGGAEEWPAPSLRSLGLRFIRLAEVGLRRIGDRQED